jgi:hypothetical protein
MDPHTSLTVLAALTVALIAAAIVIGFRLMRASPEKRERLRRLEVNRTGRLGDAFITEADASAIFYEYSVHGVYYTASQDVSALRDLLPPQPERLIGVAHIKYSAKNPANSILICEEWSGLRPPRRAAGA